MKRFSIVILMISLMMLISTSLFGGDNERISVLQKKAYPLNMKFELGIGGGMSVADRYTQAIPAGGELIFHPFDFLSIGGLFLYTKSSETNLSKELKKQSVSADEPERTRTKWLGAGEIILYPIYGKFSLFSEIAFNYHIYLSGGGGVANIVVDNYTTNAEKSYGTKPVYTFAGGVQTHLFRFGANKDKYVDLKIEGRYFGYSVDADPDWLGAEVQKGRSIDTISNSSQHRLVLSMAYLSILF
jgi:outer membrane beta-barrel protein